MKTQDYLKTIICYFLRESVTYLLLFAVSRLKVLLNKEITALYNFCLNYMLQWV